LAEKEADMAAKEGCSDFCCWQFTRSPHRRQVMATLRKIIEIQRQSELIINIFAQNLGVGLT
jgi:hypothetical protein